MSITLQKTKVGLNYLTRGKVKAALRKFEEAVRVGDGSNLQRDVAAFFMSSAARYRRECKKRKFKNANLIGFGDVNSGEAWSDVDIAAILLAPNHPTVNNYLKKFLGRNEESIRFQRRYAYGQPLTSWTRESGKRYTRYTQTNAVKERIGM